MKPKKTNESEKQKACIAGNQCPVCHKNFMHNYKLHKHIIKRHKNFMYWCTYCNNTFHTNNGLYKHNRTHQLVHHKCTKCGKTFQYPQYLANHIRLHSKKKLLKCDYKGCDKKYGSYDALQFHYEKHFAKKIQCGTCDFKMDTRANLRQHVQEAHGLGIKAYCEKMFSWPTDRCNHQIKCKACIKITADHHKLEKKLSKATSRKH